MSPCRPSSPGVEGTVAVACYAISTSACGVDELQARLGGNLPKYSTLKRGNCAEPTYLFLVDQLINVEVICAEFGFDCVQVFEGYLRQKEYSAHYCLDGFGGDLTATNRLISLQPCKKIAVKKWTPWRARWYSAWHWPWSGRRGEWYIGC